ncbi:MAG: hypothetical protein WC061_09610 [Melioribacteraceae bacterium]
MTLLPIIYTSLLIFSALFTFVLIISYISYKTKTRNDLPPYLRNFDPKGVRVAVQPAIYNNVNSANTQYPRTNQVKIKKVSPKAIELERSNHNYNKAIQEIRKRAGGVKTLPENLSDKKYRQTGRIENYQSNSKSKFGLSSERLMIMNNSERFQTSINNQTPRKKAEKRYTDHSDVNVLHFYSDAPDIDLVTLLTPQIKSAM